MRILLLISTLFFAALTYAQQPLQVSVQNSTIGGTDSILPFWLSANRNGMVRFDGEVMNITGLSVRQNYNESDENFQYAWGVDALAAFGKTNYSQFNQIYGRLSFKGWELAAGMFHEPTVYAGLSTTNGNLAYSQNARPLPRIMLATRDYKPMPFLNERLWFKASYSEGFLNDERFVENTRLHHKTLYLLVPIGASWELEGGLEHLVMWGGTSPVETIGSMPSGLKAYLRYITGASGDESFPGTDQLNVAGNQLGTYQFRASRKFSGLTASFYLSHPFEDLSGMNWRNWPDNLLGLHIGFDNKQQGITDVVYEFTNTRQQSIRGSWDRQEPDSYFTNGVYQSGHTYHQQVIGSPLFFPITIRDGISRGIRSNQFYAHHVGIRGNMSSYISWKGMVTYINHFGRYFSPYNPSHQQLSGLLQLHYDIPEFPIKPGLTFGADTGNVSGRNAGVELSVKWIL